MDYLLTTLGLVLALRYLWVLYLAVMNLKRVKDTQGLNKPSLVLGTTVLLEGYIVDVLVNWLILTPVLLELPRETTVTARLKRHNRPGATSRLGRWRYRVAQWFEPILDPFDPSGDHI